MSIIVTHISQHGIIHAADSNLTDTNTGKAAGEGQKLFEIPQLESALTVAGAYSVDKKQMDEWMKDFISADTSRSLAEFVDNLRNTIDTRASAEEKGEGYFIHIAGYAESGGTKHPEFYHITNYEIVRPGGSYIIRDPALRSSEDFWSKYEGTPFSLFAGGKGIIYCNGYPDGRQAYFTLLQFMAGFRSLAWNNPDWDFRPPSSIDEEAAYLRNDMQHINLLFLHSNLTDPPIGGEIKIHTIPSP